MSPCRRRPLTLALLLLLGGAAGARAADPLPPGALLRLGTQQFRQPYRKTPAVHVVAASGGKVLATRSDTRTVRVWDAAGKLLQALEHPADVSAFAVTADGKHLATAAGGTLFFWDVLTGRQLHQWQGHERAVACLAFSPDGQQLASGAADHTVRLWEPATGKELRKFEKVRDSVAVAFAPDGKTLAAGRKDGTVHLWDAANGAELKQLAGDGSKLSALAFAPDGKALAVVTKITTRLWDIEGAKELRQFGTPVADDASTSFNYDEAVAFSPDGNLVATAGKSVRLWEAATGKPVRAFGESRRKVSSVAFLSDKVLASGGGDQALHLWDVATGKEPPAFAGHRDAVQCAAFSPDGTRVATGGADRALYLWDAAAGKVVQALAGHDSGVTALAFSADGKQLASADSSGAVRVWDLAGGTEPHVFQAHAGWVTALAFSPDGKALASAGRDGKLRLYDVAKEREIHEFPAHAGGATAVAFSADGKLLASGSGNGQVRVWKMDLGQEVPVPEAMEEDDPLLMPFGRPAPAAQPSPVLLLQFAPGGKALTSWLDSGAIVLWDVASRKPLRQFDGPAAGGTSAAFSADGKTLAARDKNNQLSLREAATGQERLLLQGHPDRDFVWALAFAPDGRRLVSAGDDTTAFVWDVTGRMRDGQLPAARLTAKELDAIWADLAHERGDRAYRGVWAMVAAAPDAIPYLQDKLRPVKVDPKAVEKMIADLDSRQFAVRQKAVADLEELSELAEKQLQKALEAKPPLEVKQRIEKLLEKVAKERNALNPHRLRILRVTEVLEQIGSDDARQILEDLAEAPEELRLIEQVKAEVQACLTRMERRVAKR